MKTALVIGGTAATGRSIVAELKRRDFRVSLYNRGRYTTEMSDDIELITGDPHFRESIHRDLAGREWDVAVATYGRTRLLSDELTGRVGHFVAVSGMPVVRSYPGLPSTEGSPLVHGDELPEGIAGIVPKIAETEQQVLANPGFTSTVVRYPYVYGPHSVVPMEWHVIKRVQDRRKRWLIHDGGLAVSGRCASVNAAALIGTVIDQAEVASGKIYHAADSVQFTQREWIQAIAAVLDYEFEFVDVPPSIAPLGRSSVPMAGEYLFALSQNDRLRGVLRHNLPSSECARVELGYQESVDPKKWIHETVQYWIDNPPEPGRGGLTERDFDYAAEDSLDSWFSEVARSAPVDIGSVVHRGHAYDHPKKQ